MEKLSISRGAESFLISTNAFHLWRELDSGHVSRRLKKATGRSAYTGGNWNVLYENARNHLLELKKKVANSNKRRKRWEKTIADVEGFVSNSLNRFRFFAYQFGHSLQGWLVRYNHLVEGHELGRLSRSQEESLRRAEPIIRQALEFFERCVRLYNWSAASEKLVGSPPPLPTIGVELEDLQEAIVRLRAATSADALESVQESLENELALVELQQELGHQPLIGEPISER